MKLNQRPISTWYILILLLGIGVVIALAGCGSNQPAAAAVPASPVTVQLAWVHSVEYSGFYFAEENGYYAEEGLAVELAELGSAGPIQRVVAGEAQFGITSGDTLVTARAEGSPIVAVATIYQRSPVAFISLAEKNISRPQDLVGAKVLVHFDGTTGLVYNAMLSSVGIDPSRINSVPRTNFGNDPLLTGQVDVMDAFVTNQPVQLALDGHQINAILASDYGIDVYANIIFTSEEIIAQDPDMVERFLRATVRGMQSAVDNPEVAAALALRYNPELSLESEVESMRRSLPLIDPADSFPGHMTAENWQTTYQILLDQGFMSGPLDVEAGYTLTFLEKIYGD